MEQQTLTIQDAIIQKQKFDDYWCQICFQIALKPVQCCGPCHKKFCTKCVSDWKMQQDRCPLKCSQQPFFVKVVNEPQVQFKCPYNPSMCEVILHSLQNFQEHYQFCNYISTEQKNQKLLKKQGKCLKGHQLDFFLGTYEEMCQSTCSDCRQVKLCRSICRKCNQLYCVFCRPPKCSKKCCPIGHKFNYSQWNQIGYICDLCGVSTSITNDGVYDDKYCNFGLCQECYKVLPNQHQFNEVKTKNPYKCNQNHELQIILPQNKYNKCYNCEKIKFCPKVCQTCQQVYCLQCKMGIGLDSKKCFNGHELIKCEQSHKKFQCIKCQNQSQIFYVDPVCQFAMCQNCFDYQHRLQDNKNRFIEQINCTKGHQLKYCSEENQFIDQCCLCKKNNVIKLFCDYCQPGQRTYCCACRPLKSQQHQALCYFGHQLQNWQSKEPMHCLKCLSDEYKFKKCFKCNYIVCLECYPKH